MEYGFLRLIHLMGAMGLGGGFAMSFFILPSALDAGPAGGAVLRGLATRRFPELMLACGVLVLLTGFRLYMLRYSAAWIQTPSGIAISLGAVLGIGAFVINAFVQRPLAAKMGALGGRIAAENRPPTDDEKQQLAAMGARARRLGVIAGAHLVAAALLMSALRLTDSL